LVQCLRDVIAEDINVELRRLEPPETRRKAARKNYRTFIFSPEMEGAHARTCPPGSTGPTRSTALHQSYT
jgi:hypothetical protein